MSDDNYCCTITATNTRTMPDGSEQKYQRVLLEQYFEDGESQQSFQQNELLEIVMGIGAAMVKFGDRDKELRKQKKTRGG